ncbi:nucleotidyltransferase family protein [Salininema proteolyticum]|uniref:NTP transferase domain-containing protein n=1 Tax=Salininema proteolyticum TaxID=1607685 RepID=A0ABV8U3K2_9ACTN
MTVTGLILAAGEGRRMGLPKALIEWRNRTFLERAADTLASAGCSPLRIVIGARAESVKARHPSLQDAFIENPDWSRGMGTSLRAGLASLASGHSDSDWAAVILVDQPLLTPAAVERAAATAAASTLHDGAVSKTVVMAAYDGERSHPVLFHRSIWTDLAESLTPEVGARHYIRSHPDRVAEVDCSGLGDPTDIDTPDQLEALRRKRTDRTG